MPLVCTVDLSKTDGVKIVVENEDGKITQTLHMDGTKVTLTVKGDQATSVITQTQDKVHVQCKIFHVEAEETITCTSQKASLYESKDTFDIKSTKDTSVTSQAKVAIAATQDLTGKGMKVALTGQQELSAQALKVSVKADTDCSVEGLKTKIDAKTQLEAHGAMVKIAADGILTAEAGGVATVKGAMTNIQGNLVKLG